MTTIKIVAGDVSMLANLNDSPAIVDSTSPSRYSKHLG